jgi:hypothetical protein
MKAMSDVQTDSTLLAWVIAGVGGVVTTLVSVVAYLFRKSEYDNAQAILSLEERNEKQDIEHEKMVMHIQRCEDDRTQLFSQTAVLGAQVAALAERVKIYEEFKK